MKDTKINDIAPSPTKRTRGKPKKSLFPEVYSYAQKKRSCHTYMTEIEYRMLREISDYAGRNQSTVMGDALRHYHKYIMNQIKELNEERKTRSAAQSD